MFTPPTEAALAANFRTEIGQPWPVTLSAETYRELVSAARHWHATRSNSITYKSLPVDAKFSTESCGGN